MNTLGWRVVVWIGNHVVPWTMVLLFLVVWSIALYELFNALFRFLR